jgi:transaldolase / glucose-6-phosphate isomerase
LSRLKSSRPESLAAAVRTAIGEWQSGGKMQRLWSRDATLWTGSDETEWLGWLDIVEEQLAHSAELRNLSQEIANAGFKDALLLGMGGSSLCPAVLRKTFGRIAGHPDVHVLDSTGPAQVKSFENKIDIAKTRFIVSRKSGSMTLAAAVRKALAYFRSAGGTPALLSVPVQRLRSNECS